MSNNTYEDITQFYGAFSFLSPVEIDLIALNYKETNNLKVELKNDLKVEVYCSLMPHMKKELMSIGIRNSDLDDGLSLSYDIVDYLLEKWEVKYYQNKNIIKNLNLKGSKKNSFYGYFFTYYKSIFHQKWNYSKDYNGNLIKRSKDIDMKIKEECKRVDRRVNLSKKDKEILKDNIIRKYSIDIYDGDFDELDIEDIKTCTVERDISLKSHLSSKYSQIEVDCLLYIAKLDGLTLGKLQSKYNINRKKCLELVESTKLKASSDKVLYNIWKS